jgi:hypothetical protein
VDLDLIAKGYIRRKSQERQKQQERDHLRQEVSRMANRHSRKEPTPFFKIEAESLRTMESRHRAYSNRREAGKGNRKQHPYLALYEESQAEALDSLSQRCKLQLGDIGITRRWANRKTGSGTRSR